MWPKTWSCHKAGFTGHPETIGKAKMNTIPNSLLIEKDIPSRRAAWKNILPFAHTFNGYEHWGSVKKCREVARQGIVLHKIESRFGAIPDRPAHLPVLRSPPLEASGKNPQQGGSGVCPCPGGSHPRARPGEGTVLSNLSRARHLQSYS